MIKQLIHATFFAAIVNVGFPVYSTASPNEPLLASLIRSGNIDAARTELQQSNPTKADALFFRALIAQNAGQLETATALFDQVLILDPNHLNARRELASTLFLQNRYKQAKRAFNDLIQRDSTPQMRKIYEKYLREIDRRKPTGISGYFSFLPSSNFNRGTDNLIFDSTLGEFVINPDSQAVSGVGIQAGLSGYFRLPSQQSTQNTLFWGISSIAYEASEYNSVTATLQFTQKKRVSAKSTISYGPYARYTWREDEADNNALGLLLKWDHRLSSKEHLQISLQHERRRFLHQDHNTGPFSKIGFTYHHQHDPSLSYNLGINATRHAPNASHSVYNGVEVQTGVDKSWSGGLVTGVNLRAGFRNYTDEYPLAAKNRADEYYGLGFSLQNNKWNFKGFVPLVSCSYLRNKSNIEFNDHDVSECNLSINKRF